MAIWEFPFWLDVPFSAVLDTVTLPVDAMCMVSH
ncbi:YceK/YidQ family lipoprotein [Enterobacter kobei]